MEHIQQAHKHWMEETQKCDHYIKSNETNVDWCCNCQNVKTGYICENGLAKYGCYICTVYKKPVRTEFTEITGKVTLKYADSTQEFSIGG